MIVVWLKSVYNVNDRDFFPVFCATEFFVSILFFSFAIFCPVNVRPHMWIFFWTCDFFFAFGLWVWSKFWRSARRTGKSVRKIANILLRFHVDLRYTVDDDSFPISVDWMGFRFYLFSFGNIGKVKNRWYIDFFVWIYRKNIRKFIF